MTRNEDRDRGLFNEVTDLLDKLSVMNADELKIAVKTLEEHPGLKDEQREELFELTLTILAERDPKEALALISEIAQNLSLGSRVTQLLTVPLSHLALEDSEAALEWIRAHDELGGADTSGLSHHVVEAVAERDIGTALKMAENLSMSKLMMTQAIEQSVYSSERASLYLSERKGRNSEEEKRVTAATLAGSFLMAKPEMAQEWLDSDEVEPALRASIIPLIAERGIARAESGWLDYLVKFKDGMERQAAGRLLGSWAQRDFRAAAEWINEQKAGPVKDGLVRSYAETLSGHEPAAAADWAEVLPEGEERKVLMKKIHDRWKVVDQEAAGAFAKKWQLED